MIHIKGTKKEFERLADYVLRDYLGERYETPCPLNVQSFARDYLKMTVHYMDFPEEQRIAGLRYANHIYIDRTLSLPEHIGARNFTIAHECAHEIINCQDERYNGRALVNCRAQGSRKQLITDEDFCEWQANVVASCLLMRPYLVEWAMFTFAEQETITIYGNINYPCMYVRDSEALHNMSVYMGVSKAALRFRLRELGRLTVRPYSEFDTLIPRLRPYGRRRA